LSELGAMVRRLRAEAGLSGAELARRAGVPQPSVSRLEAGRRLADGLVVDRLVSALSLDAATAGQVRVLARDAYAVPPGRRVSAGVSMAESHFRRRLLGCRVVCSFSCATVPALLRTPEYASAAAVSAQQRAGSWDWLVDDRARSFVFVVTEGALRTWPGQVAMGEQLARVEMLSRRPNVRVGVLEFSAALPCAPLCDFMIAGEDAVHVETFTAGFTLARPGDVAAYGGAFAAFENAAVFGEPASAIIADIAGSFARKL
jgi:transcriptional regulator with XRE-family HTH domain